VAGIVDEAQRIGDEWVEKTSGRLIGEVGDGAVVVECCIETVDLRLKGPFVPVH
jgi:hypothetical protein